MSEAGLTERVDGLLGSALERTGQRPALREFHGVLQGCQERLRQPMRVAIVGLVKAGKSTLMNALLGEAVVATGTVETTFNVNWLRYGDEPALLVHYKDGRPPEPKAIEDLAALTVRAGKHRAYLLSIEHVEVFYPTPILRAINLIDTPGLRSFHEDDSRNTREFLALHGGELTERTEAQASGADAVLYLFSRGVASSDQQAIEEFLGPVVGRATPINAIGVLTKVDAYWSDFDDPMEGAARVLAGLGQHPRVRHLFYAIKPVCGLLALGAQTLTAEEFATLVDLAALPEDRFDRLVRVAKRFRDNAYDDVPVRPEDRRRALDRLGQYGVWLACKRIRAGVGDRAQLASELLQLSGVAELRDMVQTHFGNRAYLIKLETCLELVQAAAFRERQHADGTDRAIVGEVAGAIEGLKAREHAFRELRVLRACYEGRLGFDTEETQQVLAVTGERGTACAERLGLEPGAPLEAMVPVAGERAAHWRTRANDVLGSDRPTLDAANVIAFSFERIGYHLGEAKRLMDEASRHMALEV